MRSLTVLSTRQAMSRETKIQFLGIGAQKAGTSWLFQNLRRHPEVWLPFLKELHYFDDLYLGTPFRADALRLGSTRLIERMSNRPDRAKKLGAYIERAFDESIIGTDEWYHHMFSAAPRHKKAGEITPMYMSVGEMGVEHIKRLAPDAKIICLIRDPLDRAISSLRMQMENPKKQGTGPHLLIDDAIFRERGNYREHIPIWDKTFGDRMFYAPFGHIKSDPIGVLRQVEELIGVQPFDYPDPSQPVHVSKKVDLAPEIVADLAREAEPQRSYLRERFGEGFLIATR